MVIESFLLLSLLTVSELYEFNMIKLENKISFGISILFSVFIISALLITFHCWKKVSEGTIEQETSKFKELFAGSKENKLGRLFTFLFLLRRLFSALWVILSASLPKMGRILPYGVIQLIFIFYTYAQPLELKKENIV